MKAKEKETARNIAKALLLLPAEKQEFIKGYAEGVIAMSGMVQQSDHFVDVNKMIDLPEEAQPRERAG